MPDHFNSPDRSTGGIRLDLTQGTTDGANLSQATKQVRKSLNNYSLLLAPGILGGLFGFVVYPLLDQALLVIFGLCVLFLTMLLQLRSTMRKQLADDAPMLRQVMQPKFT